MLSYLILYYLSCQDPVMVRLAKTHPNTRMVLGRCKAIYMRLYHGIVLLAQNQMDIKEL